MQNDKAILFDLDQTLLNRQQSLIQFCQWQALEYFHFEATVAAQFVQRFVELDHNGSVWKDQVYSQLKSEFDIADSVDSLVDIYLEVFQKFCVAHHAVPETIQQLHTQGFALGLISNGRTPFQEHNFHSLGLSKYFSSIIVSEAVGLRKPDPAIFRLGCQQLKLEPEQCVFVGDNEQADIAGAQHAGLIALRFDPPMQNQPLSPSTASARFNDFSQLIEIINALVEIKHQI